jgi:outer membrane protein, multidrug efflux system
MPLKQWSRSPASRLALLTALAVSTAGCTTGRAPRTADAALPGAFEAGGGVAYAPAALDQWWTLFDDPELNTLVSQALAASPTVREAEARLEEARAIRQGALTSFNPQGALEGSASYQQTESLDGDDGGGTTIPGLPAGVGGFSTSGETRSAGLNFNVSWELDLFGRRRAAQRTADADLLAARFSYEGTRAQLAADTATSLFQARGLAIQLEDAEETVRIQRELLRVVTRRVDVGLSARSDTAVVEADLRQAEAESARLEAELRAAKRSLLVLVGRATEPTEGLVISPVAVDPPPAPEVMPGVLLARRPDVREAEARIRSAAGALTTAELDFYPRLNLLPGAGLSLSEQSGFESNTGFWSIGAGLAVPVLDRPRLQAQLRAQTARTEQAVLAYERTVQGAFSEAERTLVQLNADRSRTALLEAAEQRARVAYDAAQRRYRTGLEGLQPVLDAERVWRGTRSALAGARVQALQRSVQAFKAVGGGWSPGAPTGTTGS